MEKYYQPDIRHSNNAILELVIADFFITRIYVMGKLNQIGSANFLKRPDMLEAISNFPIGRILEVRLSIFCL